MNIIDKENDLYDYFATMYGADKRLTYVRNKDISDKEGSYAVPELIRNFAFEFPKWKDYDDKREHEFYILSVLDRLIAVKVMRERYSQVRFGKDGSRVIAFQEYAVPSRRVFWKREATTPTRIQDSEMIIPKLLGEPVSMFQIEQVNGTEVKLTNMLIPKLKYIGGIDSILDMQQVYQGIEMFIGAQKDSAPETVTPNDVKIVQAGFDKRVSFRHR